MLELFKLLCERRPNDGTIICSQLNMEKAFKYYYRQATIVAKQDIRVEYIPEIVSVLRDDDIVPEKHYKLIYIDQRTDIVYNVVLKEEKDYVYMINTECLEDF